MCSGVVSAARGRLCGRIPVAAAQHVAPAFAARGRLHRAAPALHGRADQQVPPTTPLYQRPPQSRSRPHPPTRRDRFPHQFYSYWEKDIVNIPKTVIVTTFFISCYFYLTNNIPMFCIPGARVVVLLCPIGDVSPQLHHCTTTATCECRAPIKHRRHTKTYNIIIIYFRNKTTHRQYTNNTLKPYKLHGQYTKNTLKPYKLHGQYINNTLKPYKVHTGNTPTTLLHHTKCTRAIHQQHT